MKKKTTARIGYIDTAKCIAIVLTLLGHAIIAFRGMGNSHPALLRFLYTFHMPVFFVVSGVLFNAKKWLKESPLKFILSRCLTLLLPYLFLDITGGIFKVLLAGRSITFDRLSQIIQATFSFGPSNVGPNWFLPAMFIASILFYFFMKYYRKWFKYFALIPIILIGLNVFPMDNSGLIFLFRGVIGFTFMYLGYMLRNYFLDEYNKRWDVLILAFILLVIITRLNGQIDLWGCVINNPIYMILGGLVGTFFVIGIAKHLDNKLFRFIGENTITFMATHNLLIIPLHHMLNLDNSNRSLVIVFLLVLILEIPIMYIYSKLFPRLIGKKKAKQTKN